MDGTVLIADDDRTIRTVLTQALTRAGCRVHATGSMVTLLRWVEEGRGDAVISDVVMPDGNGLKSLPKIAKMRPDLPVIVISAQNTIMTAIQAAEADAFDYLPKPFDLPDLMKRVGQALERKRLRPSQTSETGQNIEKPAGSDLPLVGRSPAMQDLYRLVARVLNVDLPVLITGESGTGKSLIAQAIHDFSSRCDAPFVVATADDLGPTDALSDLMTRAGQGTILFDGIGDLDSDAQARLSRVLDGLGNSGPRVVATSQGALSGAIHNGTFREDLYYRLAGVVISVPALRERLEDIPALAEHFVARTAHDGLAERRLSEAAQDRLRAQPWPGNLRQLENLMTRLLVTGGENDISGEEIDRALADDIGARAPSGVSDERLSASVARHLKHYFDLHGGALPPSGVYQRILREIELPLLEIALDATGGNQAKCADLLGINRNTLRKKITDLEIEVTRRRKLM